VAASPRNQATNVPGLYAIGECDYQFHGANRLGANSLLSCLFSGLFIGPGIVNLIAVQGRGAPASTSSSLFEHARRRHQADHDRLLSRPGGKENPYLIHRELGDVMTRAATVVRDNDKLDEAYAKVAQLAERAQRCSLSDTGNWTNQNIVFAKALQDMFPLAIAILKGARLRDECRGAHYKPEFAMPGIQADDARHRRRLAEEWCDRFEENNRRWLKSTIAQWHVDQEPQIHYEEVDTSLIPPRPRLYGLLGAEVIEQVWEERARAGGVGHQPSRASSRFRG
jgi:succinate dehydrogenase / fumarate reductase flavoprotein subunit